MANVLVIGGSSGIGRETVKRGLAAGHSVRAFARRASHLDLDHDHLETVDGDALQAADVTAALKDTNVVVQALGVPLNARMLTGPITLFSGATRLLVPAMQQAGVRRLIAVTGFGAGVSRASVGLIQGLGFELIFGRAYSDKSLQERLIKESGLDWTIVRPGILTNGAHTGKYRVLTRRQDWRNGIISRAEVADFIVQQIESDAYLGESPVLVR